MNYNLYPLPYVSVIIPTYHDWDRLQLCLDGLRKQTYPSESFEIIIVNNAPDNKTPDSLILPENCFLLDEANPGSYAARNKALSVAKGDIYAFTDSDCQPRSDWLEVAIHYFRRKASTDRVGGNIEIIKNDNNLFGYYYDSSFTLNQKRYVNKAKGAATANMITRKHVFDNVGLFNSSLMSGGDLEWGQKAEEVGYKISYLDECIVFHPARTPSEILKKQKRVARGKLVIAKSRGKLNFIKCLFFQVMPPFLSVFRMLATKNIPLLMKIRLCLFSMCIRFVGISVAINVLLGNKTDR